MFNIGSFIDFVSETLKNGEVFLCSKMEKCKSGFRDTQYYLNELTEN